MNCIELKKTYICIYIQGGPLETVLTDCVKMIMRKNLQYCTKVIGIPSQKYFEISATLLVVLLPFSLF